MWIIFRGAVNYYISLESLDKKYLQELVSHVRSCIEQTMQLVSAVALTDLLPSLVTQVAQLVSNYNDST